MTSGEGGSYPCLPQIQVQKPMKVEPYSIDNEGEADDYLKALLAKPEYRSIIELEVRAAQYIKSAELRLYFITKGKEMLSALSPG